MTTTRLKAIEDGYLALEHQGEPMHLGSLGTFEAAPLQDASGRLRLDEIRRHIDARLGLVPRLRQRPVAVPLGLGRSVWLDDPAFEVRAHVDAVEVDPPGDDLTLLRQGAAILAEPLPRGRAPWHLRFITGLPHDRVALVQRVHHAMADGIAGVDVDVAILDLDPSPTPVGQVEPWEPQDPPGPAALAARSVLDQARTLGRLAAASAAAVARPRRAVDLAGRAQASWEALTVSGLAPRSSLNRPISSERSLHVVRTELAALKAAAAARRAKVNDVVLAAVTGGLRTLLLERGEMLPSDLCLKALIPVSLRDPTGPAALGNQVGGYVVPLPVGVGDPEERFAAIVDATAEMKARDEAATLAGLLDAADLLPAPVTRWAARLVDRQPFVNLVVTNVPGPPFPLYLMGARMLEAIPVVPLGGNLTMGVAVLSYDGGVVFAVNADPVTCPDATAMATGVSATLAALGCQPAADRAQPA